MMLIYLTIALVLLSVLAFGTATGFAIKKVFKDTTLSKNIFFSILVFLCLLVLFVLFGLPQKALTGC